MVCKVLVLESRTLWQLHLKPFWSCKIFRKWKLPMCTMVKWKNLASTYKKNNILIFSTYTEQKFWNSLPFRFHVNSLRFLVIPKRPFRQSEFSEFWEISNVKIAQIKIQRLQICQSNCLNFCIVYSVQYASDIVTFLDLVTVPK